MKYIKQLLAILLCLSLLTGSLDPAVLPVLAEETAEEAAAPSSTDAPAPEPTEKPTPEPTEKPTPEPTEKPTPEDRKSVV